MCCVCVNSNNELAKSTSFDNDQSSTHKYSLAALSHYYHRDASPLTLIHAHLTHSLSHTASSTMDMSSRSRTKSFLDFFKPKQQQQQTKSSNDDKKPTKSSRITVQSWKKDSVSSSTDERPQSFDEANEVSSDKEGSHKAAVVRQLPVVTVGSHDDDEDDEFVLRKGE